MADISKCNGENCSVKEKCYRYTAPEDEYQSYVIAPYKIKDGKFTCDLYWGEGAQGIWNQLTDIMKE